MRILRLQRHRNPPGRKRLTKLLQEGGCVRTGCQKSHDFPHVVSEPNILRRRRDCLFSIFLVAQSLVQTLNTHHLEYCTGALNENVGRREI